jgi:acyl-coenzyme A synthetase/AMP-(fatty) acid ligase
MWNILQGGLLSGATSLLFDGNPGFPDLDVIWKFAEESKMTVFGTSAAYLSACMNSGLQPGRDYDLTRLRVLGSTGSPLSPEGFRWVYDKVNEDVLLGSVSGGTDPCSAFVRCCPILPVKTGELQCRCLGVNAQAFDPQGNTLIDQVGELVITDPMPSMPLFIVLAPGLSLDDELKKKINQKIRSALSPRHVPDEILAIDEVPTTLNGKKLEVPVKKVLSGIPLQDAVNLDSMGNPRAMDYFVAMAEKEK